MEEELTILYTNIADAKEVMSKLKDSGVKKAYLNTSEIGLQISIDPNNIVRKFPGAFSSTIVKLTIVIDSDKKDDALLLIEKNYGVVE